MEVKALDDMINKMKNKFLQVNRNPFLPETIKIEKLKEIDKWITDTEELRCNSAKFYTEKRGN